MDKFPVKHFFLHKWFNALIVSNKFELNELKKMRWKDNNMVHIGKVQIRYVSKVKLATVADGDPKDPFSIATTQWCKRGRYYIPWIAPLYPWSLPYSAEY